MGRPTPWQKPFVSVASPILTPTAPAIAVPVPVSTNVVTRNAAYSEWTNLEERTLMELHKCGYRYGILYSRLTTRTRPAIRGKLQRMGLVSPKPKKPAFTP